VRITDVKCAIIGNNPVVRITTDEGIHGLGEAEQAKPYLKPHVLFYKDLIIGEDPSRAGDAQDSSDGRFQALGQLG
jgi:L-alanine-DL-glutamate epimerase-like enolase superfamily enzyme